MANLVLNLIEKAPFFGEGKIKLLENIDFLLVLSINEEFYLCFSEIYC